MRSHFLSRVLNLLPFIMLMGCHGNQTGASKEAISTLQLKTGPIISCGSAENEFGDLQFRITATKEVQRDFNTAVKLLHSFEYDEAEKVFAKIISESPRCAMAYWGVAMCNFHPLWEPPTQADLMKGAKAIEIANSITNKSERETQYISAAEAYYRNGPANSPRARSIRFENAMQQLHARYPEDMEAAIFYALALDASADPADKSYTKQKKAGAILEALYKREPRHPGIIHYIIHTYDYPGIAAMGLPAARRYAAVAPSSAHALHMPSHIFTRLGLWDECIQSNLQSVEAARCYAETAGFKGHWDEELHGLDYLVYAYLQKGDNAGAEKELKYLATIKEVFPVNFKEAYTFAASPARMALENKNWQAAANLPIYPADFPWKRFPWQQAIIHFTRLMGAAHLKQEASALSAFKTLQGLLDTLQKQNDLYKANQVAIQVKSGAAWIDFYHGRQSIALKQMSAAADMEDSVAKHPVTPGEVLPAREMYADMLLLAHQYNDALVEYQRVLQKSPNRFNSLYGAALAAEKLGAQSQAITFYKQLLAVANPNSDRPEMVMAKTFLKTHQ